MDIETPTSKTYLNFRTRDVFERLGFEKVWGMMTDQEPSYRFDFGNLRLTAVEVTNLSFQSVFLLSGVVSEKRSLMMIDYQMPLRVESFELGVALIAYALRDFRPLKPTPWLEWGRQWRGLLPWERSRREYEEEMRIYNMRPHCSIDPDWFVVTKKRLRESIKSANPAELITFEFDGEVLRIKTPGELIAMSARGSKWGLAYAVRVSDLATILSKRIQGSGVFGIWQGMLTIGRSSCPLADPQ